VPIWRKVAVDPITTARRLSDASAITSKRWTVLAGPRALLPHRLMSLTTMDSENARVS
jgi:hypothetical protein